MARDLTQVYKMTHLFAGESIQFDVMIDLSHIRWYTIGNSGYPYITVNRELFNVTMILRHQ